MTGPGRVAQLVGVSAHTLKGCGVSPLLGPYGGSWLMFLSHIDGSLSKTNKRILRWGLKNKKEIKIINFTTPESLSFLLLKNMILAQAALPCMGASHHMQL